MEMSQKKQKQIKITKMVTSLEMEMSLNFFLLKWKCLLNGNITSIQMSLKWKLHGDKNFTKMEMSLKWKYN